MRNFIDKNNNVVKEGDWIDAVMYFNCTPVNIKIECTKDSIKHLIKLKRLQVQKVQYNEETLKKEVLKALFNKNNNFDKLLIDVHSINEWSAIQMLLKTAAIILDENYPDHISKAKKIYVLSPSDGNIHELMGDKNLEYRLFPAFRTHEEALLALRCVINIVNDYIRTK